MAADSKLTLPGNFVAGKNYLIRGADMLAWRDALMKDRVIPGANLKETQGPKGRIFDAVTGGGGINANTFWRVYLGPGDDPHYFLQGGQVTPRDSGDSNVPDIDLGAADSTPADGTLVWLEITGDGLVSAGGKLYAGFKITSVSVETGTALGTDTYPTKAAATGKKCHVLLASWQGGVPHPAHAGSILVSFCPASGYGIERF